MAKEDGLFGKSRRPEQDVPKQVGEREERKIRARRERDRSVWFGLGMFGLVGWSVAIPTLLGIVLGVWIDTRFSSRFSWTLMGLAAGVILGCLNAWFWVKRESGRDS
ncbi:MAG: AtpZ/AtpI family protein [Desulforhabdus sp.]|jgi:ATP synthase protein I|nr:AtpZ/AtpI family protein [Desulforhabdus sp.]